MKYFVCLVVFLTGCSKSLEINGGMHKPIEQENYTGDVRICLKIVG